MDVISVYEVPILTSISVNITKIAQDAIDWNVGEGETDLDYAITEMGDNIECYLEEAGYSYDFSEYQLDNITEEVEKEMRKLWKQEN